ncbi:MULTISPECIES: ROK family protein [unclassified Methylobacterium]|uniref:ROK family protein n=1 Tax=unclassified Methylobacterium TaxID=2615210 RepID=UPI0003723A18|nr:MULTISPECIES: ROK family protein [unclassified Methylobacterium]KQP41806.1 transcriptional regulator [Methylobacterium sp. Leaf106]
MDPARLRIGIDLGGTKIAGIALDAGGAVRAEARIPTPRNDYDATLGAIVALVRRLERDAGGVGSVGIGMPGAITPGSGLVKNANSVWLNGRTFVIDIEARLGRPVRAENDANCLAVSEAVDGAGAGARVVWAIILGTGVGSGIAIDGVALSGANRIAGEWGHNPLPAPRDDERPGPSCYCGRHGCIETWLSGPGLAADHARRVGAPAATGEAVIAAARAGDAIASESITRYRERLARSIAGVINILDPDMVVLGGGLSTVPELTADLDALLLPHVFSDECGTPIRVSHHGDASGVRGAAWLWGIPA